MTHNLTILRARNVRPLKFWFPVNALKWYSIILFPLVIFHLEVSLCLSKTQWASALSSLGDNSIVVSFSFSRCRTVAALGIFNDDDDEDIIPGPRELGS